jgi:hypothetical protein
MEIKCPYCKKLRVQLLFGEESRMTMTKREFDIRNRNGSLPDSEYFLNDSGIVVFPNIKACGWCKGILH